MPTFTAHSAIGMREDLIDVIYDISPTETPIMSTLARTKATAVFHEWQTDSLSAATSANAAVEGADGVSATISPTTRLGNYTQIVQKVVQTSGTLEAVNKAGRRSERAYQLAKASSSSARKLGAILSWLKTNTSKGTSGTDPTTIGVSTRSDGATRTFTEQLLKDEVAAAFDSGGNPTMLVVGSGLKQKVSSFAGIAAQRYMAPGDQPTTIIGAADVYMSDFGTLSVVPDRFMRTRDALLIDPEYMALSYLRPFQTNDLAKTGDSEKTQLLCEFTLEVRNEAASAIVADLNPAL